MIVELDIDNIPDDLYELILAELKRQHGEGYYDQWSIKAKKLNGNKGDS